jgi:NTE family protein
VEDDDWEPLADAQVTARMRRGSKTTAFVLAGGGSLGAVQVGMLMALSDAGVRPDLVVGSSVGALNAAFFAGEPTAAGAAKLATIWRGLRRRDVFPFTLRTLANWFGPTGALFESVRLRRLIEENLGYENLQEAGVPLHVVATSLAGESVCLSSGRAADAVMASAAIPAVFPAVEIGGRYLMDGAVSGNTPILTAAEIGATRIIVLPTGFACNLHEPPRGAVARGFHALTLLIAHQLVRDLARLAGTVEIFTVPPLCPLSISPFDFGQSAVMIARAADDTRSWLASGGLERQEIPHELIAHRH